MGDRLRVYARLSPEAKRGWQRAARGRGATLSALLEALGLMLDEGEDFLPAEAMDRAQQIRTERESRE